MPSPNVLPKKGMHDAFTQMLNNDHPQKTSGDYADVSGLHTHSDRLYNKIRNNPPKPGTPVHPHNRQFMDFMANRRAYAEQNIYTSMDERLSNKYYVPPQAEFPKPIYQRPITKARQNAETPVPPSKVVTVPTPTKRPRPQTQTVHSPMKYMEIMFDPHKKLHKYKYDPEFNPPSD